ncbi:MAG: PadR family transcriptional regulator [Anaerolineae bacterium]|nr:PadR family transcriptional regulator [Anaerolineae bacterium]
MKTASSLNLELALLGFLNEQPQHGYAIHQQLFDPTGLGSVWRLKLSQLYALLHKLEQTGYVVTTLELQESRPPRKLFHLTPAGAAAFAQWIATPVPRGRALRLEFLVKLYFARQIGPEAAAQLIAAQREQCQTWLAAGEASLHEAQAQGRSYSYLVKQFRQGQIEAVVAWLDSCETHSLNLEK